MILFRVFFSMFHDDGSINSGYDYYSDCLCCLARPMVNWVKVFLLGGGLSLETK